MSWGVSTYYVANQISGQCIDIPQPPPTVNEFDFQPSGLATRIENGVLLGYKVVLIHTRNLDVLRLLIYSSETGLWSFNTLKSQSNLPMNYLDCYQPISLNGKLYWIGHNRDYGEVVLSHDFYATGTESDRYQVIIFPDVGTQPNFQRFCTTSQGYIMYMNTYRVSQDKDNDGHAEYKLRVWRLTSGEWQLVSEIYPACIKTGLDYFPLVINPFDANTMYVWCKMHRCLASTNLHKDNKFGLHNNLERSSDYRTSISDGDWNVLKTYISGNLLSYP